MLDVARARARRDELRISVPFGDIWHRELGLGSVNAYGKLRRIHSSDLGATLLGMEITATVTHRACQRRCLHRLRPLQRRRRHLGRYRIATFLQLAAKEEAAAGRAFHHCPLLSALRGRLRDERELNAPLEAPARQAGASLVVGSCADATFVPHV